MLRPHLLLVLLCGCYGTGRPWVIINRPAAPVPSSQRLLAGADEEDITPQPGPPMYGYSTLGAQHSDGHWLRLKARALVLQSGRVRVAMVQCDLGAASTLVHREVAEQLVDLGIEPANLVMATTHTHGGPGAFFGDKFLNEHVAGEAAFDPALVRFLADGIAKAVRTAATHLEPARLAVGSGTVALEAASNRSRPAWLRNFDDGTPVPPRAQEVDRLLTMLRVDVERGGRLVPLAAWTTYPVHSNSMPASYTLLHGDVHGLTARYTRAAIEARAGLDAGTFVAATATGAEGDVTPGEHPGREQGPKLTEDVATLIAQTAAQVHRSLDGAIADPASSQVPLAVAYEETSIRGALTSAGRLCPGAFLGGPQIGGSEEGRGLRGFLAATLEAREGSVTAPHGCSATKVRFAGDIQKLAVEPDDMPDVLPFQVVRVGTPERGILFATVPGEPTTELGRKVKAAVRGGAQWNGLVAVLGLTNGYATYFTTGPEYLAQNYEGGATMYGGLQGVFLTEELQRVASRLREGAVTKLDYDARREFRPGEERAVLPVGPACEPTSWRERGVSASGSSLRFTWRGAQSDETCAVHHVRVTCGGEPVMGRNGLLVDDDGDALEVSRAGSSWTATWTVRLPLRPKAGATTCRFEVGAYDAQGRFQPVVASDEFPLPGGQR